MIKRYLNSMYRINYVYVIESLIEVWLLECIENDVSETFFFFFFFFFFTIKIIINIFIYKVYKNI